MPHPSCVTTRHAKLGWVFQVSGFQSDGIGGSTTAAEKAKAQVRNSLARAFLHQTVPTAILGCLFPCGFRWRCIRRSLRFRSLRREVEDVGNRHIPPLVTVGYELHSARGCRPVYSLGRKRETNKQTNALAACRTSFPLSAPQVEEARQRRSQNQAGYTKPSVQFRSSSIAGNDGAEGAEVKPRA